MYLITSSSFTLFWDVTTSCLYGIGKGLTLRNCKTSNHFREQAKVFDEQSASQEAICAAGEQALVSLYSRKTEDSAIQTI